MSKYSPTIEPLESRIAPAAVFVFTDVDGDHVTIKSSKGTNADLAATGVVNLTNAGVDAVGFVHELQSLTLGAVFAGATITITAKPSSDLTALTTPVIAGDGFTNVGLLNASTIDLVSVSVHGDLGKILVGDDNSTNTKVGLGSLTVSSMGKYGTSTQVAGTPDLVSRFENGVGVIKIAGDVNSAYLHATATGILTTAKIGSITIGGSLIGSTVDDSAGAADDTGAVVAADGIGAVKIGGNIVGGSGLRSGRVGTGTGGDIKTISVGGSIFGGSNNSSGLIDSGAAIGTVSVRGDVIGGSKFKTGLIKATGKIHSATVGGSVVGGSFLDTGGIESDAAIDIVKIVGDLRGSTFSSASNFKHTGIVLAEGHLGAVSVGGSVIAGTNTGAGVLTLSGAIVSGADIGAVTVGAAIVGNASTPVVISGVGQAIKTKTDIAIKSISVIGSVDHALFQGGYDTTNTGVDPDAQLGSIKVGGDLTATSIVSGISSVGATFGSGDSVITPTGMMVNNSAIQSAIASIVVGGQFTGTVGTSDKFGVEAQYIGSIKIGGVTLGLTKGVSNDDITISQTTTHDVHILEFA